MSTKYDGLCTIAAKSGDTISCSARRHDIVLCVQSPDQNDAVLAALDELVTVLKETIELNRAAIRRAVAIRRLRQRGHSYSEIIPTEERPLIIELLTHCLSEVSDASSRFRKAEARALYSEGLTMSEIASLFGVTRQRVAALLRDRPEGFSSLFIVSLAGQMASILGGILDGLPPIAL